MDKQELIVESIIMATASNDLKWSIGASTFNTEDSMKYVAQTEDKLTKFEMYINLTSDFNLRSGSYLTVVNDSFTDKRKLFNPREIEKVKELESAIFKKYVEPGCEAKREKKRQETKIYDNILNSIGKENYRDIKLDKILKK